MKHIFLLLTGLMLVIIPTRALAQGRYEVKGVVSDEGGPAIGVTVLEQGTTNGTSTDLDGAFTLYVSGPDAVIEVSCIGYKTYTYTASAMPARLTIEEDNLYLDDVVVIGYGSLSKKELSSSVVQVNKEDFFRGSMNNPMEMLTGKVAGLTVNTTAGANPNSTSNLQVRGATSLTAGNSPLIVIDGVIGGSLRNVSAQDIESMTVLKDAASAAIYGTRGANGVILITTRKGSEEAEGAHITYDSWFGVNFAQSQGDVLSADEFRRSLRGNDYGYSTDWYSLLMRDFSYETNQYISLDGNTKNGTYNASFNYKSATGLDTQAEREEFGGHVSVDQSFMKNRLKVGVSLSARRVNETWGDDGMFNTAMSMNPTMPVYNEDGSYYQPTSSTGARNPVAELEQNDSNGQRLYLLGAIDARVNIITTPHHNFSTSVNYSLNYDDLKSNYYSPSDSGESFWGGYDGRATITYEKNWTNQVEWLFNYQFVNDDHNVRFVGGYSYQSTAWETVSATNYDFTFDSVSYHDIGSGSYLNDGKASMYSGKSLSKLVGVFARVNYNWKDIIMAAASVRYEGSTKFGANHKWGVFPAGSLAWEMANMNFLTPHHHIVNSLKPRVSYGVTGRSDFSAYQSLSTYSTSGTYLMDGQWVTGYAPSVNANPDLGWEKLVSWNVGLDFGFFNNRLRGSVDWFNRQSQDLLYNYTAPQPPFVYSSILVNVGTTSNEGVEVSLGGDIFAKKNFTWTMNFNYSYGTTRMKKLSNSIYKASYVDMYLKSGVGTSEYFFRIMEGGKVGQFYGYEYCGVSDTGELLVYNQAGEEIPVSSADNEDKRYIGNGAPKHFLSWSNSFSFYGFDINFFFNGAFGFDIFNMRKYNMGLIGAGSDNVLRSAYLKDKNVNSSGGVISSYFLEKGDYFKLENVTVGYSFSPKNKDSILSHFRVYVSAKNLGTITKYTGTDPSAVQITGITPSVDDTSAYPLATQVTLGVTVRF